MSVKKRIQSANPMHIVLLADDSNSMNGSPAKDVTVGIQNWLLELQQKTKGNKPYFRFTFIPFGDKAELNVEALSINDIDAMSVNLSGTSGTTNIASALSMAADVLRRDKATAAHCPPFVFVYTDGHATDAAAAIRAGMVLKSLPLPCGPPTIVALGFGDVDDAFLKDLASMPEFYKKCPNSQVLSRLLPALGTPATPGGGAATVESFMEQISGTKSEASGTKTEASGTKTEASGTKTEV